jgi:hypothetical protein
MSDLYALPHGRATAPALVPYAYRSTQLGKLRFRNIHMKRTKRLKTVQAFGTWLVPSSFC